MAESDDYLEPAAPASFPIHQYVHLEAVGSLKKFFWYQELNWGPDACRGGSPEDPVREGAAVCEVPKGSGHPTDQE